MSDWDYLDQQLKAFAAEAERRVPVLGSPNLERSGLASGLGRDLRRVLIHARREWPTIIRELDSPISIRERHDLLLGYHHLMQRGDLDDPILQRAKIITQLYFDLIYFRDRVLVLLRTKIREEPRKFRDVPYLRAWLELVGENEFAGRLKGLRNAFAHGKWSFLPDFSGIVCYPELKTPYTRYQWTQEELATAHVLLYAFQVVFFQVASEEI